MKYTGLGLFALSAIIGLNLNYAINDYGVLDNRLHVEVRAQLNDSENGGGSYSNGGGGSTGGNSGSRIDFSFNGKNWWGDKNTGTIFNWYPTLTECTHSTTSGLPPYVVTVSYNGKMIVCTGGDGNCGTGTACIPNDLNGGGS